MGKKGTYIILFCTVFVLFAWAGCGRENVPFKPTCKIVFLSRNGTYLMDPNGSKKKKISSKPALGNFSWSPDGTRIAYADIYDIYFLDYKGNHTKLSGSPGIDWDPDWSPDGNYIAFVSERPDQSYSHDIFVINLDGSEERQLTFNKNEGLYNYSPDWSPDGSQIVFETLSLPEGFKGIYVINSDGTNRRLLTPKIFECWDPQWSPDGEKILFVSDRSGGDQLYIMDSNGYHVQQLTFDNIIDSDSSPDWSPDGKQIIFHSSHDGDRDIYMISADGSDLQQITNNGWYDSRPSMSPLCK